MSFRPFSSLLAFAILVVLGIMALAGDRSPSFVVWAVLFLVISAALAFSRARRAARNAHAHERAETSALDQPLHEGPCVLAGNVAYAKDLSEAMRVEFTQLGSENESSGSWSHKWTEVHRKLTVNPFYVVRDDGVRIRVEPTPDQSRLYDELENKILVREDSLGTGDGSGPMRARFATLMPEEHVWITGRLERGFDPENAGTARQAGYRESAAPASWVMRGDPTLLVSSVSSLAGHFRQRASKHARHGVFLLLCLLAPLVMFSRYVDRMNGDNVTGPVEYVSVRTDEDDRTTGYVATVRHARGTSRTETLDVAPQIGDMLSFRVGTLSDNPGVTARFSDDETMLCFALCLLALVARCTSTILLTSALPWYRSDKIKVEDSGPGRLPGR